MGSDAPPDRIIGAYWYNFVSPTPKLVLAVALDDSGIIVGHCLAEIEEWDGVTVAMVLQLELDKAVPKSEIRRGYEALTRWAKASGATRIQALAVNRKVARLLRLRYGFEEHRILVRRPL